MFEQLFYVTNEKLNKSGYYSMRKFYDKEEKRYTIGPRYFEEVIYIGFRINRNSETRITKKIKIRWLRTKITPISKSGYSRLYSSDLR